MASQSGSSSIARPVVIEQVKRPEASSNWFLPGILLGLVLTGKNLVLNLVEAILATFGIVKRDKMPTVNYPEEKYEYSPRSKATMF
jgi:hypothetical protein